MTNQRQIDALIALLREQLRSTDRATARQRLIDEGADPGLVDQALARINAEAETRPMAEPATTGTMGQSSAAHAAPPSLGSGDPAYVARIRDYLEQYRDTYTRDALQQKLLDDGHDPEAVRLAAAQVYGFEVRPQTPLPVAPSGANRFVLALIGTFLLNYTIVPMLVIGSAAIEDSGVLSVAVAVLILIGEIVAAVVLRRRNRDVSRGMAWGIAASLLPVAGLALLFGICLMLFSL